MSEQNKAPNSIEKTESVLKGETAQTQKPKATLRDKILTIVGIVLCVILIPILVANVTMIIQSYVNEDEAPSFFGITPFIVLTESMEPEIMAGDLVIVVAIDAEEVEDEMIITFFDPASKTQAVVTHRVYEIHYNDDGSIKGFETYGDNNNGAIDEELVPVENLIGKYLFSIPLAGHVAMFMQTTPGLIVCVVVPLVILIGYDIIRRRVYEKGKAENIDSLMAELEALRKEKEQKEEKGE